MSEKRFELGYIQSTWWKITDTQTGNVIEYNEGKVTDLLNSLVDENEQLRQKIGICKDFLQQITLSDDADGLNVTLWDILMEKDDEEFGEYLKRKAILRGSILDD